MRSLHNSFIVFISFLPFAAQAADSLLFTGAEVSGRRNNYGQVGVVTPLPGSQLGSGLVMRGVVDGLTYQYKNAGGSIDGDSFGAQATLGYQESGTPGWWAFYTGPVYRHTSLSPRDNRNDAQGNQFGWVVQAEGERNLGKQIKINLSGNYIAAGNNEFWTRLRVLYRIDGELFAGPETIYQGDDAYRAWSVGAGLFGFALSEKTMLGVKAGMRKNEDFSAAPYGGFELGYKF